MDKVIGLLGGMGPQATIDFFQKVVDYTDAHCDQQHIQILIDNNPKIPDRTSYIMGRGENPLKYLISSAIKLQMMGADYLAMPCNTAHYFYDQITQYIDIPFINMIEEVAITIKQKHGTGTDVGLLATPGTYKGRVYDSFLKKYGLNMVVPDEKGQKTVYNTIYNVKQNLKTVNVDGLCSVISDFKKQGVGVIILGCTELPLLLKKLPPGPKYIDSTAVLAKKVVECAKS